MLCVLQNIRLEPILIHNTLINIYNSIRLWIKIKDIFLKATKRTWNVTFCWPGIMQWFLVNDQRDAQIPFYVFIFLFVTLYMFRAHRAHHQERQIVSIQPLVAVCVGGRVVCKLGVYSQPAHATSTNIEWLLSEVVLIQFVSPDDVHDVLETCRELQIKKIHRKEFVRHFGHLQRKRTWFLFSIGSSSLQ
jgi:hypothetical protein